MTDERSDTAAFGFWVYLMTDLIVFATLFAAFFVLRGATFGGPAGRDIFRLPNALAETVILLASSLASSLAMNAVLRRRVRASLAWFGATFALGASFLALELSEFGRLIAQGDGPTRSAFLSAFFTLVGAHGLHIAIGLLWMIAGMIQLAVRGPRERTVSRLDRLNLFWHFLDLVWIFIFTAVYLVSFA